MLPKSVNSVVAEIVEVVSDTEMRLKGEFRSESGKGTSRVREKLAERRAEGTAGLPFKILPFINQQEMYRGVYQRLKEGGCIGIFPEGLQVVGVYDCLLTVLRRWEPRQNRSSSP